MTTEEMLEISVNDEMDTFAWSVKNVIELGVKSGIVGRVMPVLYHVLGEIEAHTELARWYRDHAKNYDSGMTESLNWYCDFLTNPSYKEEYPQYWGEAKATVNEHHPGYIK